MGSIYDKLRGAYGSDACDINRFTATANVSGGAVIVENTRVGVVVDDTLSGAEGLAVFGTDSKGVVMPKSTGAIAKNAAVYWEVAGDPIGGTADSGAATATVGTNLRIGRAVEAAASGDATVIAHLQN